MKNLKKYLIQIRVNRYDLIYRYKGKLADIKLDEFDNALGIINKIRDGEKNLSEVKNNQILKCSIKQGMKLSNFMMIIH